MKKSMRIIVSLALVVVMCLTLASCGKKLSGTYEAKVDAIVASYTATYEFSGSNVEITKKAEVLGQSKTTTFEGTYEITGEDDDLEITITLDDEDDDIKSGTFAFEEGEDYIKIGLVKYELVD